MIGKPEARHGSIVPGKEASFVVLGDDPLSCPKDRIKDVPVLETWSLGKRVYSRKEARAG